MHRPQLFGSNSTYVTAVALLFVLALFYSTYKLTESPPTWYDEGIYIQVAHSFATNGTQSMQIAPGIFKQVDFLTIGYPVIMPIALSLRLFGDTLLAARIPMVIFILLFAAATWWLLYRIAGPIDALLGLLLVVTFPVLYGNGKNVLGEVPGLLYATLALIALWQLESNDFKGAWNYVWLGAAVGITAASKPIFLLLPIGVLIALVINIRSIPIRWKEIAIAALSFAIPMMLWVFFQFGAEANPSAILSYYANPYGVASVPATVAQNIVRFFHESTPLYCAALMFIWLLSVCIRIYGKEKITIAEQSAFAFSILIMLAYLRTAGWYRYFFEAMTMALVFAPISLRTIFTRIGRTFAIMHAYRGALGILFAIAAMQLYQLNFSSWVAEHYRSTGAAALTAYFSTYPHDRSIFIYNSPATVVFLSTNNYYQYLQPTDAIGYGNEEIPALAEGIPDDVLVPPDVFAQHPEKFTLYRAGEFAGAYQILHRK